MAAKWAEALEIFKEFKDKSDNLLFVDDRSETYAVKITDDSIGFVNMKSSKGWLVIVKKGFLGWSAKEHIIYSSGKVVDAEFSQYSSNDVDLKAKAYITEFSKDPVQFMTRVTNSAGGRKVEGLFYAAIVSGKKIYGKVPSRYNEILAFKVGNYLGVETLREIPEQATPIELFLQATSLRKDFDRVSPIIDLVTTGPEVTPVDALPKSSAFGK